MTRFAACLAFLAATAVVPPAGAGPVGVHVASGSGFDGSVCNWLNVCLGMEHLMIAATEGGVGTANYHPQSGDSVQITLDCTSFSSPDGHSWVNGVSAHEMRASGLGEDGVRYYITLEDRGIYDLFWVTTAPSTAACGAGRLRSMSLALSDFTIAHAGNLPPHPSFKFGCDGDVCSFDGQASRDLDGSIVSYTWTFFEGYDSWYYLGSSTGPTTTFTFSGWDAPRHAVLTVRDDSGDSATVVKEDI